MVYLMFNGVCEEALNLYAKAYNTKIDNIMKYKDAPANPDFPISEEEMDKVINASMTINGLQVMASDTPDLVDGNKMYLSMMFDDVDKLNHAWNTLKDGAMDIYMEPTESFFAVAHGSLRDKYGINWMFTVEKQMNF